MKKDTTDKLLKKERDFTSLKQAAKDPDYGYGYGKVTRKKVVALSKHLKKELLTLDSLLNAKNLKQLKKQLDKTQACEIAKKE